MSFRPLCALMILVAACASMTTATAQNPTSKAECIQMTRGPLEQHCRSMFANQAEQQSACLAQVGPQLDQVCEQFFGSGQDFCATCTSSCTQNFPAGNEKRGQCLSMCLAHPGCK